MRLRDRGSGVFFLFGLTSRGAVRKDSVAPKIELCSRRWKGGLGRLGLAGRGTRLQNERLGLNLGGLVFVVALWMVFFII